MNPQLRNYDLEAPSAREFMLASHLRLRLFDYFNASTTLEHRYYAIQEIAIVARYINTHYLGEGLTVSVESIVLMF